MKSEQKISTWQLVLLLLPIILATEILPVTDLTSKFAHNRTWLAMIPSMLTGLWSIMVLLELNRRHPGRSIIQYSQDILGKIPGSVLALIFILQLVIYSTKVASETVTFVSMFALPRTPEFVSLALFMLVSGLAAWGGVEVIARCCESFIPVVMFFYAVVFLLLVPSMHPSFLSPIIGPGWLYTVFQSSLVPSAWFGEFLLLGFVLPYVGKAKHLKRSLCQLLLVLGGFVVLIALQSTMVAGPLTEKMIYSYYLTARYISVGDFFERIDPIIVAIWMFGLILKESLLVFALAEAIKQVTGATTHRLIVLPTTLLMMLGCLWFFPNLAELRTFLTYTFPVEGMLVQNLLPTLLLLVDGIRGRKPATAKSRRQAAHA